MVVFPPLSTFLAALLLLFFYGSSNVVVVDAYNSNRIVNGTDAPPEMFKFLSKLLSTTISRNGNDSAVGHSVCTSTVISKRHLLTAAHCVIDQTPRSETFVKYNPVLLQIVDHRPENVNDPYLKNHAIATKFIPHPSYSTVIKNYYDIAIIEFPEGTDFGIEEIPLVSDYVPKDGDMATAAGYGAYKFTPNPADAKHPDPAYPDILQMAKIPVQGKCKDPRIEAEIPVKDFFCAGSSEGWADHGDSGGPLMLERNGKFYQIGVAHGVVKDFVPHYSFYVDLSIHCDWIAKVTKGEAKCVPLPAQTPSPDPPKGGPTESPKPVPDDQDSTASPPSNQTTAAKTTTSNEDIDDEYDGDDNGAADFGGAVAKILFFLLGTLFFLF